MQVHTGGALVIISRTVKGLEEEHAQLGYARIDLATSDHHKSERLAECLRLATERAVRIVKADALKLGLDVSLIEELGHPDEELRIRETAANVAVYQATVIDGPAGASAVRGEAAIIIACRLLVQESGRSAEQQKLFTRLGDRRLDALADLVSRRESLARALDLAAQKVQHLRSAPPEMWPSILSPRDRVDLMKVGVGTILDSNLAAARPGLEDKLNGQIAARFTPSGAGVLVRQMTSRGRAAYRIGVHLALASEVSPTERDDLLWTQEVLAMSQAALRRRYQQQIADSCMESWFEPVKRTGLRLPRAQLTAEARRRYLDPEGDRIAQGLASHLDFLKAGRNAAEGVRGETHLRRLGELVIEAAAQDLLARSVGEHDYLEQVIEDFGPWRTT